MTCPSSAPAPLRCPTLPEIHAQMLALLPQGRAFQSREGGPAPFHDAAFQGDLVQDDAFQTTQRRGSILSRFWYAVSEVFFFLHERLCALRLEFFCATERETHELWMAEYGLPDPCDPFPDLCTKVAALGGARCDYYRHIAARAGWAVDCIDVNMQCEDALADCAMADCDTAGGPVVQVARLLIVVYLNESPAYVASRNSAAIADCFYADGYLTCPPPVLITPLKCILDRVVHAHLEIVYQTRG